MAIDTGNFLARCFIQSGEGGIQTDDDGLYFDSRTILQKFFYRTIYRRKNGRDDISDDYGHKMHESEWLNMRSSEFIKHMKLKGLEIAVFKISQKNIKDTENESKE